LVVEENDYAVARAFIEHWEKLETESSSRENKPSSRGFLGFLFGLIVGMAIMYFAYRSKNG
jgi:hypothetical protein